MVIFELNIFGITLAPTYYGLMYALAFIFGYLVILKRSIISKERLDDLFTYIFAGVVLGGRLGYILFYNFAYYLNNSIDIFKVWEGGMSFHGGVIGVIIAMLIFSKRFKQDFLKVADQVTLVLPIGLGLGRIGNYLNKELLGYEGYNGFLKISLNENNYFPSTLLEAFLEGLVLFLILNGIYIFNKNKKIIKKGQIASLFLLLYGVFRLIVEIFFRQPDSHIGYIYGYFTLGEILSLPMIIAGIILFVIFRKRG